VNNFEIISTLKGAQIGAVLLVICIWYTNVFLVLN